VSPLACSSGCFCVKFRIILYYALPLAVVLMTVRVADSELEADESDSVTA